MCMKIHEIAQNTILVEDWSIKGHRFASYKLSKTDHNFSDVLRNKQKMAASIIIVPSVVVWFPILVVLLYKTFGGRVKKKKLWFHLRNI